MVMPKSGIGRYSRAIVEELFDEFGSAIPLGVATVAVLVSVPVAVLDVCAVRLNVAVPFTARLTVALMLPAPLGEPQLEPAEAVQVHVALLKLAGSTSVTVAPVTAIGPLLVTTILNVVGWPGVTFVALLVLVMTRSVDCSASVSVAALLAPLVSTTPEGGAMLAELDKDPVAFAATVAVKV